VRQILPETPYIGYIRLFLYFTSNCVILFTHIDSDQTSDRIVDVLYNHACMRHLIPEAWYKMGKACITVATDRTEPNALRVPQKPASEDQDIDSYHIIASFG
jgi:hypothetical protein